MPEPETRVKPVAYEVTVWPEGTECIDSATLCVTVTYRGHGKWAVVRGSGGRGPCLNSDGDWEYEHIPSERSDEWLASHRFSLDDALGLARKVAPHVTVNGMTATEVVARHLVRHPRGCND